ncbi:hypothetical protein JCM8097_008399 [Rhodosporidiobolus ruineniae]
MPSLPSTSHSPPRFSPTAASSSSSAKARRLSALSLPDDASPPPSSPTRTNARWSADEEDDLVLLAHQHRQVSKEGKAAWQELVLTLKARGHPGRSWRAAGHRYRTLETRAEAMGVPLTGHLTIAPWTLEEDARIVAISDLHSTCTFAILFTQRGHYDLKDRYQQLKPRAAAVLAAAALAAAAASSSSSASSPSSPSSSRPSSSSTRRASSAPPAPLPPAHLPSASSRARQASIRALLPSAIEAVYAAFPSMREGKLPPAPSGAMSALDRMLLAAAGEEEGGGGGAKKRGGKRGARRHPLSAEQQRWLARQKGELGCDAKVRDEDTVVGREAREMDRAAQTGKSDVWAKGGVLGKLLGRK